MIIAVALIIIVGVGIFGYSLTVGRPAPVVIDPNATFSGYIESEQETRFHSMRVHENVTGIHFILSCGWNDFDLYGRLGELPSRSYYHFSSIASGGEDYYYSYPEPGIWHLMIYTYSGTGQYNLYIEFNYE
jgi:hypothetical protein